MPQDTLYTKFCGVRKEEVPICPNVGWFKDFADPQSMLDPTFNGKNILEQGNVNWPQLNVPAINSAMKTAAVVPVGADRNKAWANINHMIAEQAPAIPYLWDKTALVELQGRRRRGQRVLHDPRPELHLPEVGGRQLARTTPEVKVPRRAPRPAGHRLRASAPLHPRP